MYIKLTPDKPTEFYTSKSGEMPVRVKHILGEDISQLLVSNIYMKTYIRKHLMLVRYAVMELSVEEHGYGVDIISILVRKLHNKWHVIDTDLKLWSEFSLASPWPTKNTTNDKLYLSVWNNATGNVEILKGDNNGLIVNITTANYTNRRLLCEKTELIWLDHLHVCPFIRLNSTEIVFKQLDGNNSLQIGESLGKTILQKWEFRIENELVLICMSTYLKIYNESGDNDLNDAFMYQVNMHMQCAAIVTVVQLTMFRLKL